MTSAGASLTIGLGPLRSAGREPISCAVKPERRQFTRSSLTLGRLATRIAALPRGWVLVIGLALTLVIAAVDYVTGPRVLLNIFYLLPVMLVAWATASTGYGLVVAAASCLVTPVEAMLSGFRVDSLPVALWNGLVRLAVFSIVLYLMENMRTLVNRLQEEAMTDELTGLANRRAFGEVAAREIERSRRFKHELSLAYIDIDNFKLVNDRLGHDAGDRTLIALASLALATARSVDTVARLGGDEFVIIMPETGAKAALPVVTRLREAFPRVARVGDATITCSIGLASYEHAPGSVDEMLTAADALMYQAKTAGRDRVRHALVDGDPGSAGHGRLLPFSSPSRP